MSFDWSHPFDSFDPTMGMAGATGAIGGLFGNSGSPYSSAQKQYQNYYNQAQQVQNPFYNAGTQAIPQYQNWLGTMQDPSAFINNLMKGYTGSPYQQYEQQQGQNAATNAASAGGLIGSTPYMQASAQTSEDISNKYMEDWLKNVLGINTEYGRGQQNLMQGGQESANQLTRLLADLGGAMGMTAYGQQAAGNQDFMNTLAGLGKLGMAFVQ